MLVSHDACRVKLLVSNGTVTPVFSPFNSLPITPPLRMHYTTNSLKPRMLFYVLFSHPPTPLLSLPPHRNRVGPGVSHWLPSPVLRPESRRSHVVETASSYPTPLFLFWTRSTCYFSHLFFYLHRESLPLST